VITDNEKDNNLAKTNASESKNHTENTNNIDSTNSVDNDHNRKYKSSKKTKISLAKRISVWNKHIGKDIGSSKCCCCKTHEITQMNFACGHVISEHNGGTLDDNNMRPICATCNSSMGTKDMREFMKEQHLGELN